MSTTFEQIKDANQLQDYLQKHAAATASGSQAVVTKDPPSNSNDYMGMKQLKGTNSRTPGFSDRYEKSAQKSSIISARQGLTEEYKGGNALEDEQRSIHTELDYSKKDASRHIVQGKANPAKLRLKLLRNLEGVRKNTAIQQSQVSSSQYSLRSRMTNASRTSQAVKATEEAAPLKEGKVMKCEACSNDILDDEDLKINEDISLSMPEEMHVTVAYNEFRKKKGMQIIDFSDRANQDHMAQLCMDCLLECFEAKKLESIDEVSAYRGSMMHGIGLLKYGQYSRKQGDEMGIQQKRRFENTHHGISKGFDQLAMPANKETILIDYQRNLQHQQSLDIKSKVAQMSQSFQNSMPQTEQPAGSRLPKPFKKTFEDKLPEWIEKFRQEGLTDVEINEIIKGKTAKYVGKWGNTSKVGVLINNYNSQFANEQLKKQPTVAKSSRASRASGQQRNSSLPAIESRNTAGSTNPRSRRTKSTVLGNKQLRNSQKTASTKAAEDYNNAEGFVPFQTTNQVYHELMEQQDFTAVKKNFKKKTPFTQWSNAYFSGGVHFNPPTSGI